MEGKAAGYGKNGGGRADGPGSEEGRGLYSTTRDIHSHTHSLTHSLISKQPPSRITTALISPLFGLVAARSPTQPLSHPPRPPSHPATHPAKQQHQPRIPITPSTPDLQSPIILGHHNSLDPTQIKFQYIITWDVCILNIVLRVNYLFATWCVLHDILAPTRRLLYDCGHFSLQPHAIKHTISTPKRLNQFVDLKQLWLVGTAIVVVRIAGVTRW